MNVIICIDDNNGMMFNKRRQSKDSVVREHMLNDTKGAKLWLNSYSASQFEECQKQRLCIDDNFLENAGRGDFSFVENLPLKDYLHKINRLIIYRWNRKYPADFRLDIDPDSSIWKLVSTEEFPGSSHEKITKDVYEKIY